MRKIIASPFIALVKLYQMLISPLLPQQCRHLPTCSHYAHQALQKYPLPKALYLTLKRLSHCHPWGTSGHDPLP